MTSANESLQQIVDEIDDTDLSEEALLDRVVELYFLSDGKRADSDTNAFGTVLEQLAYKSTTARRAELANQLALAKDAPTHLMRRLAFDNIIVARPVLQYSDRLSNKDLVTLASKLGQDHLHAIAHRLKLTPPVTDVLVKRGRPPTLTTVAQNSGAKFSPDGLSRLERRAEADSDLAFALGLRPDLHPGMFTRFSNFVKEQLSAEISFGKAATKASGNAAGSAASKQGAAAKPNGDGDPAADQDGETGLEGNASDEAADVVWKGPLQESALANIAREGRLDETLCCLARMTKLEETMARHCLLVADTSALMVLCKANGFASGTFSALLQIREANTLDGPIDKVLMLKRYDAMKPQMAKRIIQFANKKTETDTANAPAENP
ncbi:MAG: DUF2336 domain-containing protein [Hyphomicrobiales bacterium]|nr:DUF2336 domain-containing protein [Hyphomicrobiales bacterium]